MICKREWQGCHSRFLSRQTRDGRPCTVGRPESFPGVLERSAEGRTNETSGWVQDCMVQSPPATLCHSPLTAFGIYVATDRRPASRSSSSGMRKPAATRL